MTREPAKILCDIFTHELSLRADQIMIQNQQYVIPPTLLDLFIVVIPQGIKAINTSRIEFEKNDVLFERITTNNLYKFLVNFCSHDDTATNSLQRINAVLNSTYCTYIQELYSIRISALSSDILPLSKVEGGSMLTRYGMFLNVEAWDVVEKEIPYFEDLNANEIIIQ